MNDESLPYSISCRYRQAASAATFNLFPVSSVSTDNRCPAGQPLPLVSDKIVPYCFKSFALPGAQSKKMVKASRTGKRRARPAWHKLKFFSVPQKSNTAKEFLNRRFYRLGNPQQRLDGNDFFAAFNFAKIFGIQVHGFRQFFLGETGIFTSKTDGVADHLAMPQYCLPSFFRGCHAYQMVGGRALSLTPAICWYFRACSPRRKILRSGPDESKSCHGHEKMQKILGGKNCNLLW